MEIKEELTIENPFKNIGKFWLYFSGIAIIGGICVLLMSKSDFLLSKNAGLDDKIPFARFMLKLTVGLTLLGMGIKYLKVSLLSLFKFDPEKRLTENLSAGIGEQNRRHFCYNPDTLIKILQSKNLELIHANTLIENITLKIFTGLKNLPPRYFQVSQNFVNALISSLSPVVLLFFGLFLHYLEIFDLFSGNRFAWIALLISVSMIFSWSPFSPITNNSKVNYKGFVIAFCIFGTGLIIRTASSDYGLPEVPAAAYLVAFLFIALSGGIFYAFFHLLKRRIEIEKVNDNISVLKQDFDVDIHPDEMKRIIFQRMIDSSNSNITNRIYRDWLTNKDGKFDMHLMQETQPVPKSTIKDSELTQNAEKLTTIGFIGAGAGIILLLIFIAMSSGFVSLLLSSIACLGILNFGLKLMHLSSLFLSEFIFESSLITVIASGEYKSAQLNAGHGINDHIQSKNTVTRTSITLQLVSTSLHTVSFMQVGRSNPFEQSPRYIVSMDEDPRTVDYLIDVLNKHISGKSQIAGISSNKDIEKINTMNALGKDHTTEIINLLDNAGKN